MDVTVEEETPVHKKSRLKALTKPVTLHKFFKKRSISDTCNSSDSNHSVDIALGSETVELTHKENESNFANEYVFEPCSNIKAEMVPDVSPEKLRSSPKTSTLLSSSVTQVKSSDSLKSNNQSKGNNVSMATSKRSKPIKRSANSDGHVSPNKRQKQANIFNMFVTQNTKTKTCPICKKDLKGFNNMDVNMHIDKCVIE